MNKAKKLLAAALSLGTVALAGCEEQYLNYNEQHLPVSEVEEILEDIVEEQNPDEDFEVSIFNEGEDD